MTRDGRQVLTEWLLLNAQRGDERAFKQLHDLWSAEMRRFVLSKLERPDAADEVLTEVWLAVARGLHRLDDPACFPRWAFRIVERRSADWIRRRGVERRRRRVAADEAEELAPAPLTPASTEPADDVLALRTAIARLPPAQRELLRLFYDLGRSVGEIAEILAIPPGTVKSRLFAVREILKQQLEMAKP